LGGSSIRSYFRVIGSSTVYHLQDNLRRKAIAEGKQIDDTFRNINGMQMQLSNVQYLMTEGKRGLSGASSSIKKAYVMMRDNPDAYAIIREEARRMVPTENNTLHAFMEYLKARRSFLKEEQVCSLLKKAEEFCHSKIHLLGNFDVREVRDIQQKIASGGTLRFIYGIEEAKRIQDVVNAYYCYIKTNKKTKATASPISSNHTGTIENASGASYPCACHSEWLIDQIIQNGLEYIDYREKSGCLWIVGGRELSGLSCEAQKHGYKLILKEDGCRAFPGRNVWWTKDNPVLQQQMAIDDLTTPPIEDSLICNALLSELASVVAECFPRGIRPGSIIDRKKLQRAYTAKYAKDLDTTIDLQAVLPKLGITIGEFVKVLSAEDRLEITNLVHGIIADGMSSIFYSELLNRHASLWERIHVEDSETLVNLLRSLLPEYHYNESCLYETGATYESDLLRAYGESVVLSCEEVHRRLPYIDLPTIKMALSRSHLFVWSSTGVFAKTDSVHLADEDIEYVENIAIPEMNRKGYYGLNQLPLQASCELNPELSFYAIRDAMYWRHMASRADRMRVIITPKGKTVSAYELIQGWCKEQERTTSDELAEIERDITGSFHNLGGYCACCNMIRINQNEYVNDRLVSFDIIAVDNAIALFAQERITSLTAITSFTSFPDVPGYTWNLYLVESFLRRFSKRYCIEGGPAQTSYMGCIAPNNQVFGCYEDKLAAAVIQDNVLINESSIGDYLVAKKYVLRRISSQIKVICGKAIKLQEQRSANSV